MDETYKSAAKVNPLDKVYISFDYDHCGEIG